MKDLFLKKKLGFEGHPFIDQVKINTTDHKVDWELRKSG